VLYAGLFGVVAAGTGSLVRNQVSAIVGWLVWLFVAENIALQFVPGAGRWLPVPAGSPPGARPRRRPAHPTGCRGGPRPVRRGHRGHRRCQRTPPRCLDRFPPTSLRAPALTSTACAITSSTPPPSGHLQPRARRGLHPGHRHRGGHRCPHPLQLFRQPAPAPRAIHPPAGHHPRPDNVGRPRRPRRDRGHLREPPAVRRPRRRRNRRDGPAVCRHGRRQLRGRGHDHRGLCHDCDPRRAGGRSAHHIIDHSRPIDAYTALHGHHVLGGTPRG
jgi:hypothetical protein